MEREEIKKAEEIKEILRKQLLLLSENSKRCDADLPANSHAIVEIAALLSQLTFDC